MVIVAFVLATLTVPAEVTPFIPKGTQAIAIERGDLNRDGREDVVVVLDDETKPDDPRELRILTRQANGSLKLAERGPKAVYCRECGGMMGDPFMGITVKPGRLTIEHYGGSAWRWSADYTFAWSRRDQTWQLVRIERTSFHAGEPENVERTIETPPKDFGKIDLADFDPADH